MRILINSLNYKPELTGIGKYSSEMAEWLATQGHDVRVIAAPPYYPMWCVHDLYSAYSYRIECIQQVKIYRCPLYVPSKTSGAKRLIHLASFALSSFPVLILNIFWRPQVVLTIEPPLFSSAGVLLAALLSGSKSWLHIQDFEIDAAFDLGILSSTRLKRLILKLESWLMGRFDTVSTISNQMVKLLDLKGAKKEKQVLFPNWVDTEVIYPLKYTSPFKQNLGISISSTVFLYSGNMGQKQGLEIVVDAAKELISNKNIIFVMCGHGAAYEYLYARAEGLDNIHWLPLQPMEKLNDLLNMADVHLLPQKAGAADLVMPSKLTGMLASGRPVLATVVQSSEIADVLISCGVIVPPENIILFVEAIKNLAENSGLREKLGKRARNYAVNYLGKDTVLSQFESILVKSCRKS